jgi:hypothetical protein
MCDVGYGSSWRPAVRQLHTSLCHALPLPYIHIILYLDVYRSPHDTSALPPLSLTQSPTQSLVPGVLGHSSLGQAHERHSGCLGPPIIGNYATP